MKKFYKPFLALSVAVFGMLSSQAAGSGSPEPYAGTPIKAGDLY